jgi:adenylate cyclase
MSLELNGELVPVGGGDAVPLIRPHLTVGRRETCDICMRFPNISGIHCELTFRDGYWFIKDLNSTNGVKVNGTRIVEKLLKPNDEIIIGKRRYHIDYVLPADQRAPDEEEGDIISGESLLEKAGLDRQSQRRRSAKRPPVKKDSIDEKLKRILGFSNDDDDEQKD